MSPRPYKDVFTLQMFATGLINPMGSTDREYDRLAKTLLGRSPKDHPLPETKIDWTTGNVVTSRWITGDLETGDDSSLRMFADIPLNEWNEMSVADRIPFLSRAVGRRRHGSLNGDAAKLLALPEPSRGSSSEQIPDIKCPSISDGLTPDFECPPKLVEFLDRLLTAKQIAYMVHLEEKSLKPKRKNEWGEPEVPASGTRPAKWKLRNILPALKKQFPVISDGTFRLPQKD